MLRRNTNLIISTFTLDILSIFAAVGMATWMRLKLPYGLPLNVPGWEILLIEAVLLYPLIFLLFSLYDPDHTFRAVDEFQILIGACLVGALTLAGLIYFTMRDISRLYLIYFYTAHLGLVASWRCFAWVLVKNNYEHGRERRRVLLIGGGESAQKALQRLYELSWAGVQLIGYLTDGEPIPAVNGDIPLLGSLNKAEKIVKEFNIDDVLIALPAETYNKLQMLIPGLIDQPCNIWVVPDYFSLLIYGAHVEDLGDVPMISLKSSTLAGYQRVIKRAFDLIIGSLSLVLAFPLMGLITLIIKLDSPGPAIFRQNRVGENGRVFLMYKFRSMVQDAEERFVEVIKHDNNGKLVHKIPNDPRVTRVGWFLRRTSLDELPNLFNVLKGDMSLVGPRPELPIIVEQYESWQHKRLAVPQGITGWWQINGRSDKPMHLHTEDDIYYVQNYSLFLDIQILAKTVRAVLKRKGAF